MKQFVFILPLILLLSSTRAIEVGWNHQDDVDDLDNQDEFIVGGAGAGFDLQSSSDSALRLTNGIFDLYRLLSSDNQKLNQIVSNVKQTVGKDTYAVNHVFKHIKNGNYYLELDTDKYNFAVTFVRMPNTKHIHDNDSDHPSTTSPPPSTTEPSRTPPPPSTTAKPAEPSRTTPPSTKPGEPSRTTPPSTSKPGEPSTTSPPPSTTVQPSKTTTHPSTTAEPSKTNPSTTTKPTEPSRTTPPTTSKPGEPSKTTPPSTSKPSEPSKTSPPSTSKPTEPSKTSPPSTSKPTEPSKTSTPSTTKPTEPSKTTPPTTAKPSKTSPPPTTSKPANATQIQQEAENLRRLEDKRFRQILGQWHLAGVKTGEWFDDVDYKACQVITIYTHGNNYYLKTLNNAGNDTYKMTDEHIESVDKKNNVFKLNNNVYRYKTVLLQGKNYKVKVFQLSNLNNSTDVSFYTENSVDRTFISKVFADHYADLKLFTIQQDCD